MKKGQAAKEFMMAYGWVLLIVFIALAVFAYYGIASQGWLKGVAKTSEFWLVLVMAAIVAVILAWVLYLKIKETPQKEK